MAKVTNTHHITPIGLPSGAVILPSASVDVPEWDEIKDRKNLAFYVLTGVLAMLAIGQAAVFVPARRASNVPPVVATRAV